MNTDEKRLSERVFRLRRQREMTRRQLSDAAGCTEQTIYNLETHGRSTTDTLQKIAAALGVTAAHLLGGAE